MFCFWTGCTGKLDASHHTCIPVTGKPAIGATALGPGGAYAGWEASIVCFNPHLFAKYVSIIATSLSFANLFHTITSATWASLGSWGLFKFKPSNLAPPVTSFCITLPFLLIVALPSAVLLKIIKSQLSSDGK